MSRISIPDSVRRIVTLRANHRCEYCGIPSEDSFYTFQLDHIISLKHGGGDGLQNLAWSCFPCNIAKGSDISTMLLPNKTLVRLFNPREDDWSSHFELADGMIYAKTDIGRATVKLLKINEVDRIIERQIIGYSYPGQY